MPHRTNDPEGIRRKIVEAAFELFTTEGYNSTPMHAVRDHAGVSSGALAHHFRTKHELGLAVIQGPVAEAVARTWIRTVQEAHSALEGVGAVFSGTIADIDRTGNVKGCPLGNLTAELAGQNEDFRSAFQLIFDRWTLAISSKLMAAGSGGPTGGNGLPQVASFIVAAFSGALLMAKASQNSAPLRECWSQLHPFLTTSGSSAGEGAPLRT